MIRPNTLRQLDRLLGVPICMTLTALRKGLRIFHADRPLLPPRRVLLIELAEMGSMVLADPAIQLLQSTGATTYILTLSPNRACLRLTGSVNDHNVFTLSAQNAFTLLRDSCAFIRWTRQNRIDTVIDLELFTCLSAILAFSSGAGARVGFHRDKPRSAGLYRGDLFTHKQPYNPDKHITANYLGLIERLQLETLGGSQWPRSRSPISPDAGSGALARIRDRHRHFSPHGQKLVLINPNVGDLIPQRQWPTVRYTELIRLIFDRFPESFVALIGSSVDAACTEAIACTIGDDRCGSVAGMFGLDELPGLFSRASLLITSDSGPAHFAAVVSLPVVVMFGPETPNRYHPLGRAVAITADLSCSPCVTVENQRRSKCLDNQCMKQIAVARVFADVERILSGQVPERYVAKM